MSARTRGILLAIVIAIHGFAALPIPHSIKPSMMQSPLARTEIERWSKLLSRVGIDRDVTQIQANAILIGTRLASLRKTILTPVSPLFRYTGTGQGWSFFNTPDAYPDQLRGTPSAARLP